MDLKKIFASLIILLSLLISIYTFTLILELNYRMDKYHAEVLQKTYDLENKFSGLNGRLEYLDSEFTKLYLHEVITNATLQQHISVTGNNLNFVTGEITSLKNSYKQNVLSMLNGCFIYSVAQPSDSREVTGNDICTERNAGTCIFTINYGNPTNDLIERCTPYVTGKSDKMVAYCCNP